MAMQADTRVERAPRRRRRWPIVLGVIVVLLVALAIIADRVGALYAENTIASEVQKQGFGAKPKVKIEGFPFLTQVASRHFPRARMTAHNVKEGPLNITSINASVRDVRTDSSFQKGSIGSVDGTATVSFSDLAKAGGQDGVELSADGPDKVKAKVDLGIIDGTAIAQVTKVGRNQIRVHAVSVEGMSLDDLGDTLDFTVPVDELPLGMSFQTIKVTSHGVELRVVGSKVKF